MKDSNMKQTAIQAVKEAGKLLLERFEKLDRKKIKFKSKHEILTSLDLQVEKVILNIIKKKYPDHHILSEESGEIGPKSDYLWIIDPLDGTTNYSMGNPLFNVSLALAYKNEVILGIVNAPYLKELYISEKGKGAFLNGKKIKVSQINKLPKALLTFCHGSKEKDIKRIIKIYQHFKLSGFDMRQLGSAGLELSYVARGSTEAIMIPGTHLWDVAAGTLIVREAGGKVTDFQGKEWSLKSRDILASNDCLHSQIIKIINKIEKDD